MKPWGFYGRKEQLAELGELFGRRRWFFAKVTGRRRIGKTTLIEKARESVAGRQPVFYVQIPDSESAGVLSAIMDAMETFQVPEDQFPRPRNMGELVKALELMAEAGYILILDEFQYFNRKGYEEFCSLLQAAVDRLSAKADRVPGGLVVLGSIHTEMKALLDDRSAPLYNRVTHPILLEHLDIGSIISLLQEHSDAKPERLLFLWNLFEGVPKFYRDCHERDVLGADRRTLIHRMFFESSSPLRTEADNWFLRELRGRYDVVLKFVARKPGSMHNDLVQAINSVNDDTDTQIGGYLKVLIEKYRLIEKKLPIFAKPKAKKSRYYISDNFLRSWLAALANPVSAIVFRPVEDLVREADDKLRDVEGGGFEKLVAQLYEERNRKRLGDFRLSERIQGYWDSKDTEIDLVAVSEEEGRIRFGSCKRSPDKLVADINNFKGHVSRFLEAMPDYNLYDREYVGLAPQLNGDHRKKLEAYGLIPQDLNDLTAGLE